MQAYSLCIKVFGYILIILFLSSCSISNSAYHTRKTIRQCGCENSCTEEFLDKVDNTTYYRLCGRK